jgi:hypothetical protein
MRIGYTSMYAWRPHVEHLFFLSGLTERAGHESFYLACDADLPTCYSRQSRDRAAWLECLLCRAGGVRSYTAANVDSIGRLAGCDDGIAQREWAHSSASTLGRFESNEDYASDAFTQRVDALMPAVQLAYRAARAWIRERRLDAVCAFNGRMDVTRAVFEAARSLGVRFVSVERTWFSDGLQLYPDESCMGLGSVHRLMREWRERPLTQAQALRAASYGARRFLRNNANEWRAYNVDAQRLDWPVAGARRRILLIPSSRNEVWGHADWDSGWADPLEAYDALIDHLGLQPSDLLLRCHPNWAENIGSQGGEYAERHYTRWAQRRGVTCIAARDKASTLGLIEQCDAIVVANGSAALEAGMLGKQVIAVAPSIYQEAGLRDAVTSPADLPGLRLHAQLDVPALQRLRAEIARQTLRFAYTMVHRIPQYMRHVRAETTTRFRYDLGADPARFIDLLRTGRLQPDDDTCASDAQAEDAVLERVAARDWQGLLDALPADAGPQDSVLRRPLFRPVDVVRQWMPVGDR